MGQQRFVHRRNHLRAALPRRDEIHNLGHQGAAEQRILMGDHAAVAPHAPVPRGIHRHSLADLPAVPRVVANGQVFHLHVDPGHHEGRGTEGFFPRTVGQQLIRGAGGGDHRTVPGFADKAEIVFMDHDLLPVFIHPQKDDGRSTRVLRRRVHRGLQGRKIA